MYDKPTVELALEALELGFSLRQAAYLADVSRETVRAWATGRLPHARAGRGACRKRYTDMAKKKASRAARPDELPQVVGDGPLYPDIDESDKDALIERMQLENAVLRGAVELLKGGSLDQASNREKSQLIEWLRQETGLPLKELTAFLRISKSSYEYWRVHLRDVGVREAIGDDVERIFREEGREARGYRFVHAVLASELGKPVSEKVVRDVMRARGLEVVYRKRERKYSSYGGETDAGAPNLPLDPATGRHDFSAAAPNEKWATDITEFRLPDAPKVYLSPVVDLFDSKPVGWAISEHPDAELANASLLAACAQLGEGERPFCHSDRGCQYRTEGWKAICERYGIERSMSRKGRSPDNAACEGFFGRLKNEFFYGRDWSNVSSEEFADRLDDWLRFYSEGRLRAFRIDGKVVYDTIDNHRRALGYVA